MNLAPVSCERTIENFSWIPKLSSPSPPVSEYSDSTGARARDTGAGEISMTMLARPPTEAVPCQKRSGWASVREIALSSVAVRETIHQWEILGPGPAPYTLIYYSEAGELSWLSSTEARLGYNGSVAIHWYKLKSIWMALKREIVFLKADKI